MITCQDPALTYLNNLGYNVVRLPRSGIVPLDVLGKKRGEQPEPLGDLTTIWQSSKPVPKAKEDAATSIKGQVTRALKLSVGITLLEKVLGALGASSPSLRASYKKARTIQFRFGKPKVLTIDPLVIGDFLRSGDLADDNPLIKYFLGDGYHAYAITEVLQSNAISVTAQDEVGGTVEVKVPDIKGVVNGEVEIEESNSVQGELTYRGKQFLTFGYKAFEIAFVNGRWDLERVQVEDENAMLSADPSVARKTLAGEVVEEEFSLL
jgi:hypothetical protein